MPDPKKLKVGDKVMFVALPDEWSEPEYYVHKDSIAFMKRMIKRKYPSRVSEIENGYPRIDARMIERGKIHYHGWAISEETGWRQVKKRT
ncbi:MAG: hypothetical protein GY869_03610 [Planctomycetes bacterium]|nr:hypothetical protein [Planctomycetota bacterium]